MSAAALTSPVPMPTANTFELHCTVAQPAEVRLQPAPRGQAEGAYWLCVPLQAGQALGCVARLRVGCDSPSTYQVAKVRAKALRPGMRVCVEAERLELTHTGHGAERRAVLELRGVRRIEPAQAQPA